MKDHFDVIANLYDIFTESVELTALLGTTPDDADRCDTVIRRAFSDVTKIDPVEIPYFDFGFIESNGRTQNFLVNREVIEVNVYATNIKNAGLVYKEIHRLLGENFEDAQVINGCQRSIPVPGIYCWSTRFKSMVRA